MSEENLEESVIHCKTIRDALPSLPFPLEEADDFEYLRQDLVTKVQFHFGEAVGAGNKGSIERFAKLFQPLGLENEGIEKFFGYIAKDLRLKSQSTVDLLSQSEGERRFEQSLVKVLRGIVKTYETHSATISSEFGAQGLLKFLQMLQKESGDVICQLLDRFINEKALMEVSIRMRQKDMSLRPDIAEMDKLCDEIAKLTQHSESFENYLHNEGKKSITRVKDWQPPDSQEINPTSGLSRMSQLKSKLQELGNYYISFEAHLMMEITRKSLQKYDLDSFSREFYKERDALNGTPIIDCLDESFYVLQKCLLRSLSTYNIDIICAVINHTQALLQEEFLEDFNRKVNQSFRSGRLGNSIAFSQEFLAANTAIIITLNMLYTCRVYSKQLATDIKQQFNKAFGSLPHSQSKMFEHCVGTFEESISRFRSRERELFDSISQAIRHSLEDYLINFQQMPLDLTEAKFQEYEVNDPFVLRLIHDCKHSIKQ